MGGWQRTYQAWPGHSREVFLTHLHRDRTLLHENRKLGLLRGSLGRNQLYFSRTPHQQIKQELPAYKMMALPNLLTDVLGRNEIDGKLLEGDRAMCKAVCLLFVRAFKLNNFRRSLTALLRCLMGNGNGLPPKAAVCDPCNRARTPTALKGSYCSRKDFPTHRLQSHPPSSGPPGCG